jgi:hypothetical protein
MICSCELSSKQIVTNHIKKVHHKQEVSETMFCVSTQLIIDNFDKQAELSQNKNGACLDKTPDVKHLKQSSKESKKDGGKNRGFLKNLTSIFDEPNKLEKLQIYPDRTIKQKLATEITSLTTRPAPQTTRDNLPDTVPSIPPFTDFSRQSQHQPKTSIPSYFQFCERARQSVSSPFVPSYSNFVQCETNSTYQEKDRSTFPHLPRQITQSSIPSYKHYNNSDNVKFCNPIRNTPSSLLPYSMSKHPISYSVPRLTGSVPASNQPQPTGSLIRSVSPNNSSNIRPCL